MRKQGNVARRRFKPLSGQAAVLFVIGIVLTEEACSETDPAGPGIDPPTEIDTPATATRTDHAPEIFASVSTGTLGGIDARFDQISKIVPEFAGYYIDDDGDVVTALTDLTKTVAVDNLTRNDVDAKLLASGGQREYKQVPYSFSQLLVWRDLIAGELMIRGDVAFMDIDQARNQLYIGLISPAADAGVRALAARADIPAAAIFLESVGRPRPDALRAPNVMADNINTDRFATSLGGIRVRIDGDPDLLCTLWLGVKQGGNQRYVTASHCTDDAFASLNTDLWMNQGSSSTADWLGDEQKDPADTCDIPDPVPPGAYQDKCRWSDASLFGRPNGATTERFIQGWIAKPVSEGGSLQHDHSADSVFTMDNEAIPVAGDDVQMVGRSSGWRAGEVLHDCTLVFQWVDDYVLRCQAIATYTAVNGDSGAPIFGVSEPYGIIGMHVGRTYFEHNGQSMYRSVISPIDGIERDLGALVTRGRPNNT